MSYTVPNNLPAAPMKVTVNDVTYNLMPGETVNIPDKVRDELLRALGVEPKTVPAGIPWKDTELSQTLDALATRVAALEGTAIELPAIGDGDTGKVLTATEDGAAWAAGGGGGAFVIADNDGTLNKTAGEIQSAFAQGIVPVIVADYGGGDSEIMTIVSCSVESGHYTFELRSDGAILYNADSASDYPTIDNT